MHITLSGDGTNLGHPTISELIEVLRLIKDKHGDICLSGAYDGGWEEDVHVQLFNGTLLIGSIS